MQSSATVFCQSDAPRTNFKGLIDLLQGSAFGLRLESKTDKSGEKRACAKEEIRPRRRFGKEQRCCECNDPIHCLLKRSQATIIRKNPQSSAYPVGTLSETSSCRSSSRGLNFTTDCSEHNRPADDVTYDEDVDQDNDRPTTSSGLCSCRGIKCANQEHRPGDDCTASNCRSTTAP